MLPEPAITTDKRTAPLFTEREMATLIVTKASEDITGTVIARHSYSTDYKAQKQFNLVIKPPSDMGSEVERILADFGVI